MLTRFKRSLYLLASRYFMMWANLSYLRWRPRVIAVTGSVGKTTMLHLIEAEMGEQAHYSHYANSGFGIAFDMVGLRGITGSRWRWLYLAIAVPLRSLYFRHKQPYYVVEIDGERPHEASAIAKWLRPHVTLWISVANSHAVYFDQQVSDGTFQTVEAAIAHEFASIPRATRELVVIDERSQLMADNVHDVKATVRKISGIPDSYEVSPEQTRVMLGDHQFTINHPLPIDITVQLQMLEALMRHLDLPLTTDLGDLPIPPGRNSTFAGIKNTTLIDSSYNAHLISMRAMLELMQAMNHPQTWLVIGDMIEQGDSTRDQHEQLADAIAHTSADRVILVGRRTHDYTLPRLQTTNTAVESFLDTRDALTYLNDNLTGGETILFKGSQYLEWLVEKLLADPDDTAKLPRQEPAARARRAARGLN